MIDADVAHLIEGPEIDRPRNALTLTNNLHLFLSDFQIFFEPVEGSPNTYRIDTFLPRAVLNNLLPGTRTLFVTKERTIEPPSPRLLAVHRATFFISPLRELTSIECWRMQPDPAYMLMVLQRLDLWCSSG